MEKISDVKTIREAVVAVPFVLDGGTRKFFDISRDMIDRAKQVVDFGAEVNPEALVSPGASIIEMVRSMEGYVFPPTMDFLKNPDQVAPFAMYIFEFEHSLDKEDLADIWQNLPPKIADVV